MNFDRERQHMVDSQLRSRRVRDPLVLAAFSRIAREDFVSAELRTQAYADSPLPIGSGQTISQPLVVALTIELMELVGNERVLEIGTGSGYAAAILGAIAREVHTVERLEELAATAKERLARYTNIFVHVGDGTLGWPAAAPYDAICVAAGAPKPPQALLDQLKVGGRLVVPHGPADHQRLTRLIRRDERTFDSEDKGYVRFVPLVGEQGWPA